MLKGRKDIDSSGNDVSANSQSAEVQDLTGGKESHSNVNRFAILDSLEEEDGDSAEVSGHDDTRSSASVSSANTQRTSPADSIGGEDIQQMSGQQKNEAIARSKKGSQPKSAGSGHQTLGGTNNQLSSGLQLTDFLAGQQQSDGSAGHKNGAQVGSGHTILGGNKTHLGSGQQSSDLITEVQSGPAYADLSVVGNDILIEVPVRNECSLENSVEEECSAEASMAKSPNSGQSLVAVHSGTVPKHAVLSLGGNENLVEVPVMSDCSTAGDKPKPGPVLLQGDLAN